MPSLPVPPPVPRPVPPLVPNFVTASPLPASTISPPLALITSFPPPAPTTSPYAPSFLCSSLYYSPSSSYCIRYLDANVFL